jgi:hypothetical protein
MMGFFLRHLVGSGTHPALLSNGSGGFYPRRKAARLWIWPHSPTSGPELKNTWSYTFTSQYVFMTWCLVKHRGNAYLLPFLYINNRPRTRQMLIEKSRCHAISLQTGYINIRRCSSYKTVCCVRTSPFINEDVFHIKRCVVCGLPHSSTTLLSVFIDFSKKEKKINRYILFWTHGQVLCTDEFNQHLI